MRFQLGPLVANVSGSIGGTTFQRGISGPSARVKPRPTRRRTPYTSQARQQIAFLSREWRALSSANRTAWQTQADAITWYNKFGVVIPGKGYWLYIRCNQYREIMGAAPLATPTTPFALDPIADAGCAFLSVSKIEIEWATPDPIQADTAWLVYMTPPVSLGLTGAAKSLRLVKRLPAGFTPNYDITAAYFERFPTAGVPGQQCFFRIVPVDRLGGYPGVPVEFSFPWS